MYFNVAHNRVLKLTMKLYSQGHKEEQTFFFAVNHIKVVELELKKEAPPFPCLNMQC